MLDSLWPRCSPGDIIVDGGNSNYNDTMRRGGRVASRARHALRRCRHQRRRLGAREGYALMVGGDKAAVERLRPVFETLAPAPDRGWGHVGPVGAGHFVKMVHNGIEYGMMQAYAEGFEILKAQERVRPRPAPGRRDLAPRQRGALLAARPDRRRAGGRPGRSTRSSAGWPTPARAAGPSPKRSTWTCRRR